MSKPTMAELLGNVPVPETQEAAAQFAEIAAEIAARPERLRATNEMRQILAAEESADALEGIRQDLTALLQVLGQISTTMSQIAQKLK